MLRRQRKWRDDEVLDDTAGGQSCPGLCSRFEMRCDSRLGDRSGVEEDAESSNAVLACEMNC